MVEMVDTRCAPEQDISGSHDGPKADRRVTHYFVALRSHARLRFLGDTALLASERKSERERQRTRACVRTQTRTPMNTKRERRDWRWNLEMYRPSDFGVRCRIIISIIPDPNYGGINSRPESESTRKEEGAFGRKRKEDDREEEWEKQARSMKEEHKRRRAPINFSSLAIYAIKIRARISDRLFLYE